MKLRYRSVIVLVGFITAACFTTCKDDSSTHRKTNDSGVFKTLSISIDRTENISITETWEKIEIIPLENNGEVVNSFSKPRIVGNRLYLLDIRQRSVFVFSAEDGSFLFKICNVGSGPGEYPEIEDYEINPFSGNIELLNPRGEVLIFDSCGTYLESYTVSSSVTAVHNFACLNKDTIVFFSLYEELMVRYFSRSESEILNAEYSLKGISIDNPLRRSQIVPARLTPFYRYNGYLRFCDAYNNRLCVISNGQLTGYLSLDFGKNNLRIEDIPEGKSLEFYVNYLFASDYVFGFNNLIENDHFIIVRFVYRKSWHTLIISKSTWDYKIINKFAEGVNYPATIDFFSEGLISVVDPMHVQLYIIPELLDAEQQRVLEKVELSDNPILLKYYF